MNLELTDKVILITGGTGGIGSQIVADFLEEGAIVVCLIRNEKKMETLRLFVADQNISEEKLYDYKCNLLNFQEITKVVKKVAKELNRIDVLINCAGSAFEYPFALMEGDQIDEMIDLNFKSPLYLSHAVLRTMFKQKEGCIINISSVSAIKKGRGIAVYAAAKAGLDTFTRALSQEVGRKNIRVNGIRPGVIKTPMIEALMGRSNDRVLSSTSLNRYGLPGEISKAALFIASNKTASFMTGESITIDGGVY